MGEKTVTALAPLAKQFATNDWVLDKVAADLAPDQWLEGLGAANPALWILGHVATYRRVLPRRPWREQT